MKDYEGVSVKNDISEMYYKQHRKNCFWFANNTRCNNCLSHNTTVFPCFKNRKPAAKDKFETLTPVIVRVWS